VLGLGRRVGQRSRGVGVAGFRGQGWPRGRVAERALGFRRITAPHEGKGVEGIEGDGAAVGFAALDVDGVVLVVGAGDVVFEVKA